MPTKVLHSVFESNRNSWKEKQDEDVEEEVGNVSRKQHDLLESSSWGAELWRRCSSGCNVVDSSSGGGASIDHQIQGLKSCEPEFLVSTPDRLLELVQMKAIDVSSASLLVIDSLKSLVEFGFSDKQLLNEPVCRLSLDDSAVCKSAFVSQHLHVCSSEDEKMSKASQILSQAFVDQNHPQHLKVFLVAGSASNVQLFASKLKAEGYGSSTESLTDGLHDKSGEGYNHVSKGYG
ncbi:uncharacterized protein A4U43_C05F13150 [Asparagus officinalis]|uniref:DEAD/DEAH box helicase domain-containing protein n=1 Tax=Asparagus officinalis TaxID=4686 RepID=A0A5P1ERB4_ASPOF|nr:uncharacterized protein A4U43_C05F13150 [Asparagus officinalis]